MKTYWIVQGVVTDPDCGKLGDTEWQFSDGPPGKRNTSDDYPTLEEGLANLAPAYFYFVPEPKTPGELLNQLFGFMECPMPASADFLLGYNLAKREILKELLTDFIPQVVFK